MIINTHDSYLNNRNGSGRGAVFTAYETIEMEASIMDGRTLEVCSTNIINILYSNFHAGDLYLITENVIVPCSVEQFLL